MDFCDFVEFGGFPDFFGFAVLVSSNPSCVVARAEQSFLVRTSLHHFTSKNASEFSKKTLNEKTVN